MKVLKAVGLVALVLFVLIVLVLAQPTPELSTVDDVDLESYTGTWYSVYEYPVYYGFLMFGYESTECENPQAYYELLPNGNIKVINSCLYKGEELTIEGEAGVEEGGKLWVSFFPFMKSPYYIIGLDEDYQWSVVGTPNLETLWFLSRTPEIEPTDLDEMYQIAQDHGFDTTRLTKTK